MPPNGEAGDARTDSGQWRLRAAVKRIVADIECSKPKEANAFYGGILGMDVAMDHGWIVTFASDAMAMAQVSIASEGGSGTPVPDLSIEVDNLDEVHSRMLEAGIAIEYGDQCLSLGACAISTFVIHLAGC